MTTPSTSGIPLEPEELALLPAAFDDSSALAVLMDRLLERGDPIGSWLALSAKRSLGPNERADRNRLMRSAARHLLGDVDRVVASKGRWYRRGLLTSAQMQVQHPRHLEMARDHLMWRSVETLHLHWTTHRSEAAAEFVCTNRTFQSLTAVSLDHPALLKVLLRYPELPLTHLTLDGVPSSLARPLARADVFPNLAEIRLRQAPRDGAFLQRPLERVIVDVTPDTARNVWTLLQGVPAAEIELRYGRAILSHHDETWSASEPWTWQHDRIAKAVGFERPTARWS